MKIMVTGGAGFVGARVVRLATEQGHEVVNVDALTPAASLSAVWDLDELPTYTLEPADISDATAMARIFQTHQPDAVIHLAAQTDVVSSLDQPMQTVEANLTGTFTLLQATKDYWVGRGKPPNFLFHQVSSQDVYAVDGTNSSQALDPHTPYAATKAGSDHLALAWGHSYGLPVIVSRAANTYGPGQPREGLLPWAIAQAMSGREIALAGQGDRLRDWLYVDDLAQGILEASLHGQIGGVYNMGAGMMARDADVIRAMCRQLQLRRPTQHRYTDLITLDPASEEGPDHVSLDLAAMQSTCEWVASMTLEDGLQKTVDWHLSAPDFRSTRSPDMAGKDSDAMAAFRAYGPNRNYDGAA